MGVHPERHRLVAVTQGLRDAGNVGPVGNGNRGEGMPLWHNRDKSENSAFAGGCGLSLFFFHKNRTIKMGAGRGGEKSGLHIKGKFFDDVKGDGDGQRVRV